MNKRATAAERASTLLHAAGHSWTELVLSANPTLDERSPFTPQDASHSVKGHEHRRRTRSRSGIDAADIIRHLQDADKLTDWEREFIAILAYQLPATGLTTPQWQVVENIARRLRLWHLRRRSLRCICKDRNSFDFRLFGIASGRIMRTTTGDIIRRIWMATERQIAANQLSALRSTGPRTIEGRAASRLNSLRHGLTARKLLIPGETAERFDRFCADMRAELGPQGPLEESLVDTLTGTLWRLQRIPVLEAALCNWVDQKLVEKDEKAADPMSTKFDWEPNMLASRTPVAQEEADNERTQQLHLGRLAEVIADKDFLSKLSRYEAHLVNQARKLIGELREQVELRSLRQQSKLEAVDIEEK